MSSPSSRIWLLTGLLAAGLLAGFLIRSQLGGNPNEKRYQAQAESYGTEGDHLVSVKLIRDEGKKRRTLSESQIRQLEEIYDSDDELIRSHVISAVIHVYEQDRDRLSNLLSRFDDEEADFVLAAIIRLYRDKDPEKLEHFKGATGTRWGDLSWQMYNSAGSGR